MTPAELTDADIAEMAKDMRARGEPFAIATVIRTMGATAAKPGAKALLGADGAILHGWIGGGCVRGAIAKATKRAMTERAPQLISLHPRDLLNEKGITPGDDVDGVRFAVNGCPSKGSVDIFIELILPMPELLIYGVSPVAKSLAKLATQFQWAVAEGAAEDAPTPLTDGETRMIVVATQGKDDLASLKSALNADAQFIAFVGSQRKFDTLSDRLIKEGIAETAVAKIHAPAGMSINAVTPDEIALSILAQLTQIRRQNQRDEGDANV